MVNGGAVHPPPADGRADAAVRLRRLPAGHPGFTGSFAALPLAGGLDLAQPVAGHRHGVSGMFLAAVQIAGPLLVVLFLADVGLGLLTRVAPALNAFSLGFPLKILLTLSLAGFMFLRAAADRLQPRRTVRPKQCGGGLMADAQEKTEKATDKRMKEARSKGQLSRSQDLDRLARRRRRRADAAQHLARAANAAPDQLFTRPRHRPAPGSRQGRPALEDGFASIAGTLGPCCSSCSWPCLAGSAAQGGVHLKKFKPDFEHSTCSAGIKRLFGTQASWEGVKALLKTSVVGARPVRGRAGPGARCC